MVEGGTGPGNSSEGCLSQDAWGRTSRYSIGHGDPCGDILESMEMNKGGGAGGSSEGSLSQDTWTGASGYSVGLRVLTSCHKIMLKSTSIGLQQDT